MNKTRVSGSILLLAASIAAQANALFDVTSITDNGLSLPSFAQGTSNGIGFSFSGSLWSVRTTSNDSWSFVGPGYSPGLASCDSLHTGGFTPTWTFSQSIQTALFYMGDDDGSHNDWWDFGVTATYVSGDVEISGTAFRITSGNGGIVRLSNIGSNVLQSVDIGDGNDTAMVVETVPEPASMAILGLGAAALMRRRR